MQNTRQKSRAVAIAVARKADEERQAFFRLAAISGFALVALSVLAMAGL